MKTFDFARLVRMAASACAPMVFLLFATMAFSVAAPQRAEAAGTCTINWGTVAYRSTGNTYVMSQTVNPATLAACDPRYPAVDSGVASPTSGTSVNGGTWSAVTNPSNNTLTYTPPAGRIGTDTFTMYFCNDAGCSGAGRLTATVNVTIAAPTLTLTSSLGNGAVTTPYSQTLTASGGTAGYTFAVIAGSLPPGLSLGSVTNTNATTSTVALSGTPTGGGTFNFTIRATDSSTGAGPATVTQSYTVTIAAPTVTVTPTTVPNGTQGTAYTSTQLSASGGTSPYSWTVSAGALPAGLTLSATGLLSGTPTVGGAFTFTARAQDSSTGAGPYAGTRSYSFNITSLTPTVTSVAPGNGPTAGGTSVVITGTNLSGASAVTFGATAATGFVVNSATQITATAPAGTGTVDVRVTTSGGTSATSPADQFTYVPAPTVTSISPTAGPTSGGTTVIITGANFGPTTAVTFGATAATGFVVNSATQITATAPAGTGTIDVRVTSAGGTSATSAADQFTYLAAPTVTSVSPTAGPTAGGTTVTITGTNLSGATAVTFGATAATGYTVMSATQITATAPSGTGIVDIRVTTGGGTSATSAADRFTYVAAPTVTAVSPTSGPTGGGQAVVITGTGFSAAAGTGAVKFGATNATYTINSNTQITATSPANSAGTYDVTVTTPGGVSATSAADQYTYVPAPTVTSVTPTAGSTAGGTAVTITGTGFAFAPGTGAVKFGATNATYTINSNTQITATSPANPGGTYDVTVTTTGGTSATSAADQFTYVATPVGSSFTYGSIVTYNDGSNLTTSLSVAGQTTNSPTAYAVGSATTAQGGSVSIDNSGQVTYTPPTGFRGNDSFTWTATNLGGTSAPATATVVIGNPTLSISRTGGSGVRGVALSGVQISASGGASPYTCATSPASGALPAGTSINANCSITGTPTASGTFTFTATVTDSSTGTGPFTQVSGSLSLTVAAPTLSLSPAAGALPGATAGASYSQSFTASGGTATYSYARTAGSLPAGLTLSSGGVLSGTPTAVGTFNFTVTATDASTGGSGGPYTVANAYSVTVSPPSISLAPASLAGGTIGSAYSASVTATGGTGPYSYAVTAGSLPSGVSLSTAGAFSGTPTGGGTWNFTVTASDSTTGAGAPYSGSQAYAIAVSAPTITLTPTTVPAATVGAVYSQSVTATGGTSGYTYAITGGALPAGVTLSTSGALSGTPTAGGSFNFTVTATDSSTGAGPYTGARPYTLIVNAPSITVAPTTAPNPTVGTAYSQTFTATGGTSGYSYAITGGALPAGLSLSTGGALTGTPTAGGSFNFTITATDSSTGSGPYTGNRAYSITVGAPTVTVGPTTLPNGSAGTAYSQTATASGGTGPYTFALTAGALPPGWSLSAAGVLSGTSTSVGTFTFTLTATDSSTGTGAPYSGSRGYTVNSTSPSFTLMPPTLSATVGQAYTGAFAAGGGTAPYTYTRAAGTLPPGLTLAANGTLSGTPTGSGTFNFTVIARDSTAGPGAPYGVGSNYNFTVAAPTLNLAPATLPAGNVAAAYTATATASGGTGPYSYSISTGALPTGLSLAPTTGVISGTPTTVGSFNFSLRATDSSTGAGAPFSITTGYAVTIGQGTQTITFAALSNASLSASPLTVSATATSGLGVTFFSDTAATCSVTGGSVTLLQTGTCTIRAEQAGNGNYAPASPVSQSFTVTPANLAITAAPATGTTVGVTYSQSNTASGGVAPYSYSLGAGAFVPGTTVNASTGVVTGTPTVAGTFSYIIRATDSQTTPFTADTGVTTITIAKGSQTLAFTSTAPSAVVAGPAYTVTATATSGLTVVFMLDGSSTGCSLSAGTVTFTTPGICMINANQSGDSNWNPATQVQQSFTVVANPPITANLSGVAVAYNSAGTAINLAASITGGAHTSISIGTAPANGTATVSGDVVTYIPTAGYFGPDSFTYTATGPGGTSTPATVSLTVATPAAPTVTNVSGIAVPYASTGTAIDVSSAITGVHSSLAIGTAPAHGTVTVAGNVVTYTPSATWYGPDSFTFTATGPGGTSVPATVSLTVGLPPAPTTTNVSGVAVAYASPGTAIDLSSSISGVHSSVAIGTAPAHGTVTVAGDVVTYTPSATWFGPDSFTFTATGPGGTSAPSTVSLNVGLPTAPTTTNVSGVAVAYASPGTAIDLSSAISGVHSSVAIGTAPAHGTVTVAGNVVTYTPSATYFGPDSFTFTATGPGGTSTPSTVSLTVGLPPAPTTANVSGVAVIYASAGTAITLQPSGVYTGLSVATAPAHGTVTISGTTATYIPSPTWYGPDSFTYVATGPGGTSAPSTVSLTVGLPPAPTTANLSGVAVVYASAGTAIDLSSSISGVHSSVAIGTAPANGTVTVSGNVVTYTPSATYFGPDSFTFTATGPGGTSAPATVSLTVATPPAPTATNVSGVAVAYASAGTAITLQPSGVYTALSVATAPANGTVTISGTTATYIPSPTAYGSDSFTYVATGPGGTSAPATVSLTVATPPAPTTTNVSGVAVAYASTGMAIDLSGSITGVHSSLAIDTAPANGTVTVSGDVVTYTPAAGYFGPDSFTFTATGPGGTSASSTVSLTVGLPPAPTTTNVSGVAVAYASPGAAITLQPSGVYTGLSVATAPAHGTVSISGTTATYIPSATWYGPDSFTYVATGPGGTSAPATVSLTVATPPAPTTANLSGVAVAYASVGTAIDLSSSISGVHSSAAIGTAPAHGTVTVSGDVVTYTPSATYFGPDSFTFTATGPGGTSAPSTVSLTVGLPPAPTTANVSGVVVVYASAGTAIPLQPSGVYTSLSVATAPAHGTVSISGATATYIPSPTWYGPDSFTYVATGPGGTSASSTVSLTVGLPPAPTTTNVSGVAVAYAGSGTAIDLTSAITGVHASVAIGTAPAHGTVAVSGNVVTYTPSPTYFGADSFTFTATGPGGTSAPSTVSLTVGLPPAPTTADINGVAVAYASAGTAINVSSAITGVHSSVAIGTAPAHGTVTVSGNVVTYTPSPTYFGADSFTFTATGPGGTSAPATVSLTVGLPSAPTAANVNGVAVAYASPGVAIPLQPSGVYTALSVATAPANGTVTINGTTATYIPSPTWYGPDSFTYVATGPGGTSAPATVSLTVAIPPPPVVTPPTGPVVLPPSPGGPSQPVVVNLGPLSDGVIEGFRVTVMAQHGSATVSVQSALAQTTGSGALSAPGDYQLAYTPLANFMGTDTVTVVAFGPGGDSAPLTFTFQVAGKAPDLSGQTPSNGSITFTPTTTLVGGPFQALRITRAPAFGTATVNGLSIVFTPGVANGGSTSLDYVIDLPFGSSAAGRIDLTSNAVPAAQALTADTVQGRPVTVRISNGAGGPFTNAGVVSISPTAAGTATIAGSGGTYDLTFTPSGTFSGLATVTFSLTNTFGTTNGTLAVTVAARPDPSLDPEVRGVATSQVTTARRFADAQIDNFQRRLQDLHDGTNGSSNGISLNLGGTLDEERDPRQALRRQLGRDDRVDPGALGDDRDREMLGLDLWSGQAAENAAPAGRIGDRLNMAGGQPGSAAGGASVGFWTSGSIDWGRQDAEGLRDSRFTTQGVTAGLDFRISDTLILGGGLGYGEDKTRIGDNGSTSNGEAFTGALYASWSPAEAFYVDGVLGYADLQFDSRRWVTGFAGQPDGYADGSRSGEVRFVSAAFGRLLRSERFTTDLYARLEARDITLDGFTETGGGLSALIWSEVDQSSLSANLGASWRWVIDSRRHGTLVPSARIEWSHEFEDIGAQGVRYADWATSPTYLVPLTAWSRNALNVDLDAEWSVSDRLVLGFGYRGALGDASTSHGAEFRVKYGW